MTVYNSLHSLPDYERLLFHYDEWPTKKPCSLSRMNSSNSFVTSGEPNISHRVLQLLCYSVS
jgi:hypothetical protein